MMILGGKFLLLRRLNKFQNNIKTEMATSWRFRMTAQSPRKCFCSLMGRSR